MRVLVTGGAGYIGSICVKELLDRGHEVDVFDNLSEGNLAAVDKRAHFYRGDLRIGYSIKNQMERYLFDAVIHFASLALVSESMKHPMDYFANNIQGGIELLGAMLTCKCNRIIFSSSCAIFGDAENNLPIGENHPCFPINPYGESKLVVEKMLRWNKNAGWLKPCSLRYFNAAGASETHGEAHRVETHLIPNILLAAARKKAYVEVYGGGQCVRDYIHVLDLVDAHIRVLESGVEGAYNLGTGYGLSVNDVISVARDVTGVDIPVKYMPHREGDPAVLVANSSLAKKELGWKAQRGIEEMVKSAWDWMLKNPNGYKTKESA